MTTVAFDHVVITVADLDQAAAALLGDHGLASVAGGRHPGHGTGNRIVPLGSSYVELMAVLDAEEAATSPVGRWVLGRASGRGHGRALCLSTSDITAPPASRLGAPASMSRLRPDGVELSWQMTGVEAMARTGQPFFIQWHVDPADHPGRAKAPHLVHPSGISWVELGSDRPDATEGLDIRPIEGISGVGRVGIATDDGEIVI